MGNLEPAEGRPSGPARNADVALLGIYEISKVLTAPLSLDAALHGVANLLSNFLDMSHGLIALLSADGSPELVVGSHCDTTMARAQFDKLPEQVIGRIVVTQMPLVIEDVGQDPLFSGSSWDPEDGDIARISFVGVPIKDRGQVLGTLTIDRLWRASEGQAFRFQAFRFDDDVRFLTMVANLLGQTVRLQHLVARDRERLLLERNRLQKALHPGGLELAGLDRIVGDSAALRAVLQKVRVVARSHTTVLLRGESGTGKELFARALHDLSPRREHAYVTLNCAALPESVLESELFGHEKGAFTGALAQRKGRFELADKGTLFLDEIGEISAAFQAKLLRVLQLGEFERVGGTTTIKVDVRVVAATNRNLERAVSEGKFRADLYYRINVVPILLPPLRERTTDIPLLAREFLARFNRENSTALELTDAALSVLTSCWFPGNVRELENCVQRTATLASGELITASDFACRNDECLSAMLWKHTPESAPAGFVPLPITRSMRRDATASDGVELLDAELAVDGLQGGGDARSQRQRLVDVMESVGWVQAKAARVLGITPRQVGYALRKHEIPIKKF